MKKILNVIVFYNNYDEVCNYISEVTRISNSFVDLAIVINNDINCKVEKLKKLFAQSKNIFWIDYGENIGYLNSMLRTVFEFDILKYKYVILSNTDIYYDSKDFFLKLISKNYDPQIGCVAPSIFSSKTESYQNPHYLHRVSKRKIQALILIFKFPAVSNLYLFFSGWRAKYKKKQKASSCYLYSPNGAYMIFTNSFITIIKNHKYEYGVKLYSEESWIGELLLRNNLKCYYDSTIQVIHQESTVTGKINYKKRFAVWRESLQYILNEFYKD